jgi:hypothetical protein
MTQARKPRSEQMKRGMRMLSIGLPFGGLAAFTDTTQKGSRELTEKCRNLRK